MSAADLRVELQSGDPGKQSNALLSVLAMLAAGRDVSGLVSVVCQHVLAAPNSAPEPKLLAYDLAASAALSDADWARVGTGIKNDVARQQGDRAVRARALRLLPALPPHRLAGLLGDASIMERMVVSLRSTSDGLRAAASECLAELAASGHVLSLAADLPALLSGLIDGWEMVTNGLTDDSDVVCAASAAALATLLRAARQAGATPSGSGGGGGSAFGGGGSTYFGSGSESGGGASGGAGGAAGRRLVLEQLVGAVHSRGASVLAVALARFRVLNTVLLCHVPPLLLELVRSQRPPADRRDLAALPGELPGPANGIPAATGATGAAGAHFYDEAAALLVDLLTTPHQPVMLAAAQALLELAEGEGASAPVQAALPRVVQSLLEAVALDTPAAPATLPQVLPLLLGHLSVLPPAHQVSLFHRLLPLVAAMPSAADRTRAVSRLWLAVLQYDWGGKAVRRAAGPAPPELQLLLSDPHVKEIVSGVPTKDEGLGRTASGLDPRLVYPAFREELAGSLLHVCLTHHRASSLAAGGAGVAGASSAVGEAVRLQALVEATEWLSSAKIALQGTKACLGWDRAGSPGPSGPTTTGTTAVVDLWLQLLLAALQVAHSLKGALAAAAAASKPAAAATPPPENGLGPVAGGYGGFEGEAGGAAVVKEREAPRPIDAMLAALQRRLGALDVDMQGMLLQIATNWRALHPAVRPRAVWVCAVHLRYKSTLDSAWNSVLDAVRGLLVEARKGEAANYLPAVAEGVMAARKEAPGARPGAALAAAAAATQNGEVGLLCLERLALTVAHNAKRGRRLGEALQPIGALLKKVAEVELEREGGSSPAAKERLARVVEVLGPVATGGKRRESSVGGKKGAGGKENESGQENGLLVVELLPDPCQPSAAAYPLTLPSAAALFDTMEAKRYRSFLSQLQSALGASRSAALDGSGAGEAAGDGSAGAAAEAAAGAGGSEEGLSLLDSLASAAPAGGLPSLLQLVDVLNGGAPSDPSAAAGMPGRQAEEVSGPAAPLSLVLSHQADAAAGSITVYCRVTNRTMEELRGVEVQLLPGGPLAPGSRRPLNFRLEPLPPAESHSWDVRLPVAGFGAPTLQPSLLVPVQLPDGEPHLRCKPYAVSPLHLLLPPATPVTPAEFYQRWQALPHRAALAGVVSGVAAGGAGAAGGSGGGNGGGEGGGSSAAALGRVLAKLERSRMVCVTKMLSSVQGSLHAALHGSGWDGEVVACVVTAGGGSSGGVGSGARLDFYFRSDSADVVAHIQGHEAEVLDQLTGGLVLPAGGGDSGADTSTAAGAAEPQREEQAPRTGFMSFLRGVTTRDDFAGDRKSGGEGEAGETEEDEAVAEAQRLALEREVLSQWQRIRALRMGA